MNTLYPRLVTILLTALVLFAGVPETFAQTNIQVTKLQVSDTSPNELQNITIEVNVKNNGPQATTALQVQYALPSSMTFVSYTTDPSIPGAGTYNSGTGIWNIGALSSGSTVKLFVVAFPKAGTAGTTINSTASYVSSTPADNNASDNSLALSFTVNRPDIEVTKSVNTNDPDVGNTIIYTVRAKNVGSQDAPATGLVITDLLPAGLTYTSTGSVIPSGTAYNPATGAWTIGTLADNVTVELKIAATVNSGTTGQTITNTASVSAIDQAEESTANNSASVPITVRFPDIQITKTVSNGPYNEGSNLTYTVTVRNNGPANATNVKVKDDLVSALSFVSSSATQGTYNSATDIWDVGALASGQSRVLTIVAAPVIGSSGTSINNTAQLFSMDQNDPNTANNSANVEIQVATVDLLLEKSVNDNTPDVGQTIEFSLKLTNQGLGTGTNIVVKDVLPAGLTFVAFTSIPSASTATQSGDTVTWSKSSMTPSNQTLKFTATVAAGFAARSITNTATIESFQQADPNLNNNTSSLTFKVNGADLSVSKKVSNVAPNPGDNITYTIVIKNNGPDKANDITLTDVIPTAGLTFVSSTNSQGNAYNSGAGTWFANDINSGDSATLTITATVKPAGTTLGNSYNNTASITSVVEPDGITDNNSASALFAVGNADLGITKTVSASTAPQGGTITYILTVQNYGPHNAPLVVVNDLLPPELTYTSHSGGTYNPTTGVWNIGSLNNGATTTLTINTTVKTGTAGKTVVNTATVSSPMNEPAGATNPNTASATFKVNGADIAVTKTTTASQPVEGDPLNYTITVTNNGPDGTTGLVIKDVLPTNLLFQSSTPSVGAYNSTTGEWTIGNLANGATATLVINTKIVSGGGITNTAFVQSSSALDANTANNTASVFTSALKSFNAGACIIDLGVLPQTINNGLRPYGLVYQMVKTFKIPVYWAISPSKSFGTPQTKVDQPDFTVAGTTYYSGAFIIPAEYVATVQTLINSWVSMYPGLKVDCNRPAFNAPIHGVITSFPRAVLDEQNGDKTVDAFYGPAGIPTTAYRADGQPSNLTPCDDIYAMPHADPQNWVTLEKNTLDAFVKNGGWMFLACHSVSALETLVDLNGDGIGDLNYLSNAGLIPWGQHSSGTIPPPYYYSVGAGQYAASVASDPFMQFMGRFDGALQNGSEQINIPKSAGWRSTTTVAVWDHDHPQVISGKYPPGPAAALAYGRAFGNPNYGMIMEFTSHTFKGGTTAENVAAARTYGNFLLQAGIEFMPKVTVTSRKDTIVSGEAGTFSVNASGKTAPITYQWTSSCGGTFSNPNGASTSFTAPSVTSDTICIIRLTVIDACGRENFEAFPVVLKAFVSADLAITKTDGSPTYTPGSPVTYTVTVSNAGPNSAVNATVVDNAPSGTTISSWSAVFAGGATGTASGAGNINQTVTVPTGGTITYTINLNVPASFTGTLANTATVTPAVGTTDPNTANNSATDTDTPNPIANLGITKTDGSATYTPGTPITYTIVVTNSGPSNVLGATISDTIPAAITGVTWSSTTTGTASVTTGATGNSNILAATVNLASGVGNSVTFTVTGTVSPSATGNLVNTARVSPPSGTTDPTPGNNTATDTDTPNPIANLGVTKTDGSATYTPGTPITYTIVVTNSGPSNVLGATILDTIPAVITGVAWSSTTTGIASVTSGSTGSGNSLTATVNLASGGGNSVTFTVTGTVSPSATGNLVNTATVTPPSGTTDPTPGNNTATDTNTPQLQADLAITKTDGSTTYTPGSPITYTIVVSNNGPSNVTGATIADAIPAAITGVSWTSVTAGSATVSSGATGSGNSLAATVNLPAGAGNTVTFTVTGTVAASATGNLVNTATVTAPSGVTDPTPGNNSATDTDTRLPVINAVNDLAGNIPSGGSLTFPIIENDTLNGVGNFNPTLVSISTLTAPTKGTANINTTTGVVTYTPAPGNSGADSLLYKICDLQSPTVCDSAWVFFTITPVIVASYDNAGTVASGDSLTYPLITNDTLNKVGNFDPTLVNITITNSPNKGTASINPATGQLTYKPSPGFSGADSLVYQICDKLNPTVCDTALVVFNIAPVIVASFDNLGSVASGDSIVNFAILANDSLNKVSPVDPTLINITITDSPNKGTATLNASGQLTYKPSPGFLGVDSLVYQICDKLNPTVCDTALVVVTIGALPPLAANDINNTTINTPVSGTVATNDSDPQGLPLTFTKLTDPANGTVTFNPNGTYTYTPNAGFTGTNTFTYVVCNTANLCDTALVKLEVVKNVQTNSVIANNDATQTLVNTPVKIFVKANDLDPQGDAFKAPTLLADSGPAPGTGTVVYNAGDSTFTYTPATGYVGSASFQYRLCDVRVPEACDTALVTIDVLPNRPGNDPPVAVDDALLTNVNTPTSGTVATNDTDPDNNLPLTFTKLTDPTNGTVVFNPNGTYTYTPNANYVGPDKYTYRVCDNGIPTLCDTATVYLTVVALPPLAANDINNTTLNTPVSGTVATNDSDPQGFPLTFTKLTDPANGTVTFNPNGTYTYTPNAGFTGTNTFTYVVCNTANLCDTALVKLEVVKNVQTNSVIANNDATQTLVNTPVKIFVKANDLDPQGDAFKAPTLLAGSGPAPGTGTVVYNAGDSTFTYTPATGYVGSASFQYRLCDVRVPEACDTALVTIDVLPNRPGNDPPVAVDDALLTNVNTPKSGTVATNDFDPDNNTPLTFAKVTDPVNGTVTFNPNGTYTYTPNANYVGPDKYTYRVCDNGIPTLCDTATVYLTVIASPPLAANDINNTTLNTPVSGTVATNDSDPQGLPLTFTKLTDPANGTVTFNPNGTYTYTPNAGFTGTNTFTYVVCNTANLCDTALVKLEVVKNVQTNSVIANNDATQTLVNTPVKIFVKANDLDPQGDAFKAPTLLAGSGPAPGTGTVVYNAGDSTFTYTPATGYVGSASFQYRLCDVRVPEACDTALVTIDVLPNRPGNDPPVAVDDALLTNVNTPKSGTVATNDFDPDNNTPLTFAKVTNPANGTVTFNPNGTYTYTPNANYVGPDKYTYRVCDNGIPTLCDTATVYLTVLTSPIVATHDNLGVLQADSSITFAILNNDSLNSVSPVDTSLVTVTLISNGNKGVGTINANGSLTYQANSGVSGLDSLIYRICAKANPGVCDTALVIVRIADPLLLYAKVYLQGSLFGVNYLNSPTNTVIDSLMRDDLRVKNLIPLTSPYSYFNPTVAANTINASVLSTTGRNAIVDWVFVELRDKADSAKVVSSRSALLQRDGDIVSLNGTSPLEVQAPNNTAYFVAVRHRNHLAVMTKGAIPLTTSGTTVDFRDSLATPTYVRTPTAFNIPQVKVIQGKAMWAGNALRDSVIIAQGTKNDVNVLSQQVLSAPANSVFKDPNFVYKGYFQGDINMNGEVIFQGTKNDVEFIFQNVIKNHPGNTFKDNIFIIREQLPN